MKRFAFLAAVVLAALAAAPVAGAAGSVGVAGVVGSGPITWPQISVRTRPSLTAPVVATLTQFRRDYRPRVVLAVAQRQQPSTGKALWYRITIPGRPNGRTGWVPAAAIALQPVDRRLVIHRGVRTFDFYVRGKLVRSGKVAVGAPGMETPLGLFYVQAKFDPSWPVLGAYAFETSAYSKLSEWPGGGVVGVHGTNTPELLGQAVSHGCVRLANADIQFLRSVVPVGTPVEIVA
jgi:lipoprotein-anchoring transpeptidase ErfK/SrfK